MKALKIVGSILLVLVLVAGTYVGVITKGFRKWKNLKTEKQNVTNFINYGKNGIPSEDYKALANENENLTKTVDDLSEDNSKLLSEKTTLTNQVDNLTDEKNKLTNDNLLLTTENEQLKNENKTLLEQQHSTYVEPDGYVYSLVATSTEGKILKIIDYSSSLDKVVLDFEEMRTIQTLSTSDDVSWTARRYQKYTITNSDGSTKSVFDNNFDIVSFAHGPSNFDLTFNIEWSSHCNLNGAKYSFENERPYTGRLLGIFIMPDFNSDGNDEYYTENGYVVPLTLYIGAPDGRPDLWVFDRDHIL